MNQFELLHGDCLELLKSLPDKSVDAVVTDPPYFTTDLHFDNKAKYRRWWADELLRITKPNGYLCSFGSIPLLADIAKEWSIRFSGCWLKHAPNMRTHSAKKPANKFENFVVYAHPNHQISQLVWNKPTYPAPPYKVIQRKTGYRREGKDQISRADTSGWTIDGYVCENNGFRYHTDVIYGPSKPGMKHVERTPHPTQKPVNVLEVIIQWTTNPGDLVLDPFMGSGTTGVACRQLGRRFIGMELHEEYFKIAHQRILGEVWEEEEVKESGDGVVDEQLDLFRSFKSGNDVVNHNSLSSSP